MTEKITTESIKEALKDSGYLLEHRICPVLEKYGYYVETNIQFEDIDSGKSCEFDVEAYRKLELAPSDQFPDTVSALLLVSCKNNHFPVVGFTRKNVAFPRTEDEVIASIGYPLVIPRHKNRPTELFFNLGDFHHYFHNPYIARQYCMITKRKKSVPKDKKNRGVFKADHADLYDDIYKLSKVIHALEQVDIGNKRKQAAQVRDDKELYNIDFILIYPIMLFGGELYECRFTQHRFDVFRTDHVLLWQNISSKNLKGAYFIDMIEESYLPKYLKKIDNEMKELKRRFIEKLPLLRESVFKELYGIKKSLQGSIWGK